MDGNIGYCLELSYTIFWLLSIRIFIFYWVYFLPVWGTYSKMGFHLRRLSHKQIYLNIPTFDFDETIWDLHSLK